MITGGPDNRLAVARTNPPLIYSGWTAVEAEDEAHANARLIAAAPDLLAALERLIAVHHTGSMRVTGPVEQALAAIKKAKGE